MRDLRIRSDFQDDFQERHLIHFGDTFLPNRQALFIDLQEHDVMMKA